MTRIKAQCVFIISACLLSFSAFADVDNSSIKVAWGYKGNTGPERWGQLNPAFALCAGGKSQSPINIIKKVQNTPFDLTLHYQSAPMEIVDDGITNLMIGNTQTIIRDGHGVQINFKPHFPAESITYNGKDYRLIQFHIHSPSENEWQSQSFPLEIHFVHQGEKGQLAVIGVFVKSGIANPTLQKMIDHLPNEMGKEQDIEHVSINPINLMPVKKKYFSFMGSLTTPPCSEGVQWIVMSDMITASPSQILLLRKASGGGNARHVQPLNKRKIYYSEEA